MKTRAMVYYCECGATLQEFRVYDDRIKVKCGATGCARKGEVRYVRLADADEVSAPGPTWQEQLAEAPDGAA